MTASTNLCSRDDLKTRLGLGGTAHDDALDALIAAASEAIETFCCRRFAVESHTEYHDGGHDRVMFRHRPVTELTGLWDDPVRAFGDATAVAASEVVLDEERGLLVLRSGRFAAGIRNVKVVYSAGYDTIPDDLAQGCALLAAAWFNRAREGGDGLDARSAAGGSAAFSRDPMPEAVRQLIMPYRTHQL